MVHEIKEYLTLIREPFKVNEKKSELTLTRSGSQFLFGSCENALTLEGPHLPFVWMDEAGMMPRLAWDVAQRRTGYGGGLGRPGQILITTIPYFEGWLKSDVYEAAMRRENWVTWIKCRTQDNKDYPQEEIERMRRTMPANKFKIYYEGDWARASGLIWPDPPDDEIVINPEREFAWNVNACSTCKGAICAGRIPCDWPAFAGHDYGWNASTTGVWLRLSPDDVLYMVADYEDRQMTIDQHVKVWQKYGLTTVDEAFCDPANPEVWMRAYEMGYPTSEGNNEVLGGLDEVFTRLVTGRLKVFPECKIFLDHRATYRWATDTRNEDLLVDRPLKPQPAEHLMDALRYACMGIAERGQARARPSVLVHGRRVA